jgi:signal transduction histidine kinase
VLLLAVVALGVPLGISLRDRVDAEVESQARSQAEVVAASSSEALEHDRLSGLRQLASASARSVRGRVIVVDETGGIIADSSGSTQVGDSYSSRPEVAAALSGKTDQRTRHSATLDADILATSVPIVSGGQTIGAVRVTQSVEAVNHAVWRSLLGIGVLALVVLGLGMAAGALIARRIASPMSRLAEAADSVASGDLDTRAPVEGSSEQQTLARSFNDMTARVGRMVASQQEFVADASHQLRTPLTGLRLQLEELEQEAGSPQTRAEIQDSVDEVDRLSAIVDELLVLSRAGESSGLAVPLSLSETADRAAQRWRKAAAARDLDIVRETDAGALSALANSSDLDRALDAILENAVAYSRAGGTIVVRVAPGSLGVLDDGPGFDPQERELVLERFYRGRAGRSGPHGTGLGLAIARELVGQWGGRVSVANRPEGGGAVTLTFATNGSEGRA